MNVPGEASILTMYGLGDLLLRAVLYNVLKAGYVR
jgi:hypothetical protein